MADRPPPEGEPGRKRRGGDVAEEDENAKGTVRAAQAGTYGDVASEMFLHVLALIRQSKQGEAVPDSILEVQKEVESITPYLKTLTAPEGLKDLAYLVMQDMLISRALYNWSNKKIQVLLRPTVHWTVPMISEVMAGDYKGIGEYFTSDQQWRTYCLSQVPAQAATPKTNKPLPPVPASAKAATPPAAKSKAEILAEKTAERANAGRLTRPDYDYILHHGPQLVDSIQANILHGGPKLTLAQWEKGIQKKLFVGPPDGNYVDAPKVIRTTDPSNTDKKLALKAKWTAMANEGNLDRRYYTTIIKHHEGLADLIGVNIQNGGPRISTTQANLIRHLHHVEADASWVGKEARAPAPSRMDIEPIDYAKIPKTNKPPAAARAAKPPAASIRPRKTNKPLPSEEPKPPHSYFRGSAYNLWNSRHPRFLRSAMHPDGVDAGRGFYEDPVPVEVYKSM